MIIPESSPTNPTDDDQPETTPAPQPEYVPFQELDSSGWLDLGLVYLADRLIPTDFSIKVTESKLREKLSQDYPGYPSERMGMTRYQFAVWEQAGFPSEALNRGVIMDHPNYLAGVKKGRAVLDDGESILDATKWTPSNTGQNHLDNRNRPLHPFFKEILLNRLGRVGFGFYWKYGNNATADPVCLREKWVPETGTRRLQMLVIVRIDTGDKSLPGGMVEPGESYLSTTAHELFEEAHVSTNDAKHLAVYSGPVLDLRLTLNAWPETTVVVFFLKPEDAARMAPEAGDDAAKAFWMDVTQENLEDLFASHTDFAKAAIRAWEDEQKVAIAKDGRIGRTSEGWDAGGYGRETSYRDSFERDQRYVAYEKNRYEDKIQPLFLPGAALDERQIAKYQQDAEEGNFGDVGVDISSYLQGLSLCLLHHHGIPVEVDKSEYIKMGVGTEEQPFSLRGDLPDLITEISDISSISGKVIFAYFNEITLRIDAEKQQISISSGSTEYRDSFIREYAEAKGYTFVKNE